MDHSEYEFLKVELQDGVLWATIDHPPINLIDEPLIIELERLADDLEQRPDVSVLVLRSADPDFFLAHVDASRIEDEPTTAPPRGDDIGRWHTMCERLRSLPVATIGMVRVERVVAAVSCCLPWTWSLPRRTRRSSRSRRWRSASSRAVEARHGFPTRSGEAGLLRSSLDARTSLPTKPLSTGGSIGRCQIASSNLSCVPWQRVLRCSRRTRSGSASWRWMQHETSPCGRRF